MRYYETLYLIKPDLSEDENKDVISKFSQLVEKGKGIIIRTEEWGKKTLAYTLKKYDKGFYVLLKYCGDQGLTGEISNILSLDERILKYQTIKLADNVDPDVLKDQEEKPADRNIEVTETEEDVSSEEEGEDGVQ